jgi:hypothetical protein
MPIAAFRAGDQVPVEFVRAHQAEMAVRLPDGYPEPPSDSPAAEPPAEQPKVGGKE